MGCNASKTAAVEGDEQPQPAESSGDENIDQGDGGADEVDGGAVTDSTPAV